MVKPPNSPKPKPKTTVTIDKNGVIIVDMVSSPATQAVIAGLDSIPSIGTNGNGEETEEDWSLSEEEGTGDGAGGADQGFGIPQGYAGQVKKLVAMYENFAKNVASCGGGRGDAEAERKTFHSSDGSLVPVPEAGGGVIAKINARPSTAGPSSAVIDYESLTSPSTSARLASLETKVSAIVTLVNDMVTNEVEVLGDQYYHMVNTDKRLKTVENTTTTLEEEMGSLQEQISSVGKTIMKCKEGTKNATDKLTALEKEVNLNSEMLEETSQGVIREILGLTDMVSSLVKGLGELDSAVSKCGVSEPETPKKDDKETVHDKKKEEEHPGSSTNGNGDPEENGSGIEYISL